MPPVCPPSSPQLRAGKGACCPQPPSRSSCRSSSRHRCRLNLHALHLSTGHCNGRRTTRMNECTQQTRVGTCTRTQVLSHEGSSPNRDGASHLAAKAARAKVVLVGPLRRPVLRLHTQLRAHQGTRRASSAQHPAQACRLQPRLQRRTRARTPSRAAAPQGSDRSGWGKSKGGGGSGDQQRRVHTCSLGHCVALWPRPPQMAQPLTPEAAASASISSSGSSSASRKCGTRCGQRRHIRARERARGAVRKEVRGGKKCGTRCAWTVCRRRRRRRCMAFMTWCHGAAAR